MTLKASFKCKFPLNSNLGFSEFLPTTWCPPSCILRGLVITHVDTAIPVSTLHSHSSQTSTFWATGRPEVCTGEAQSTVRRADWGQGLQSPGNGPGAIWAGISRVLDTRVWSRRGPVGSRSCVPLGLQTPQPLLTKILEAVNLQVHHLPPSNFKSKPQAMKGLCWPLVVTKNTTTKLCPFSQDACMGFGGRKQTRALWMVDFWGPRYPSGCCWPRGRVGFRGTSLWPRDCHSWWRWEWGPLKLEDESSLRSWWEIQMYMSCRPLEMWM